MNICHNNRSQFFTLQFLCSSFPRLPIILEGIVVISRAVNGYFDNMNMILELMQCTIHQKNILFEWTWFHCHVQNPCRSHVLPSCGSVCEWQSKTMRTTAFFCFWSEAPCEISGCVCLKRPKATSAAPPRDAGLPGKELTQGCELSLSGPRLKFITASACVQILWWRQCIVNSDCHLIKSWLVTRDAFYAEISIGSLLKRSQDQ